VKTARADPPAASAGSSHPRKRPALEHRVVARAVACDDHVVVLAPDGGDVRADDAVLAVEKEAREVLSVGPPDEGVGDTCGAAALGEGLLGEPEWSSGLDQAHFVDGDGVAGA